MSETLLLLNCYSRNALAVINSVGESYRLIGGDAVSSGRRIIDPDRWFHSPRLGEVFRYADPGASPEAFREDIIAACRRYGASGVIATGTTATNQLSRFKAEIEAACSAKAVVEDYDRFLTMTDKWLTWQICQECGVTAPPTVLVNPDDPAFLSQVSKLRFPLVLKPRISYAAIGVQFLDDRAALDRALADLPGGAMDPVGGEPRYIIQEKITGELHDVAICARDGELVGAMTQQRVVSLYDFGGGGIVNRTTWEPQNIEMIRGLIERLRWNGLAIFDLIRDADGQFHVLECNPKVWGTTYLTTRAGLNMVRMSLDIFLHDRRPEPNFTYQRDLLYKFWFPECLYHWTVAPRTPARIFRRICRTLSHHGAAEVDNNLGRENWRHLVGIALNSLAE